MITTELDEVIYPVTGKELPEVIPGVSVGFRICGSVTLAYVWINKKLCIGVANCSMKDLFNQVCGEKKALKLAMAQHDMSYPMRSVLWDNYLVDRGIANFPPEHFPWIMQTVRDMRYIRP